MKLLDQVRQVARLRHLSLRTEECYARGIERYVRLCKTTEGFRHPSTLRIHLGDLDAARAHSCCLPVVLPCEEGCQLLAAFDALATREPHALMIRLLYGAGLRLVECCRLRVKDVDLARQQITVRQGKGDKDRVVMLPASCPDALVTQLAWREELHRRDRERNRGWSGSPTPWMSSSPRLPGR